MYCLFHNLPFPSSNSAFSVEGLMVTVSLGVSSWVLDLMCIGISVSSFAELLCCWGVDVADSCVSVK